MRVDILGTPYEVIEKSASEDVLLREADGYCDPSICQCVISDMEDVSTYPDCKKNLDWLKEKVLRHEITHAFLFESGLSESSWAGNEEIVDWIAAQFPKLAVAFETAKQGLEREWRQKCETELFNG